MFSADKEERPWGTFFVLHEESNYKIKRIEVKPGHRLSYQYHNFRSEVWVIIKGEATINIDGIKSEFSIGQTILNNALSKFPCVTRQNLPYMSYVLVHHQENAQSSPRVHTLDHITNTTCDNQSFAAKQHA